MSCVKCEETNCILTCSSIGESGKTYFADLRYDHDYEDRNEFDIELGYSLRNETYGDWSRSFNTNYCPFCGDRQKNQIEISLDDLEYDKNSKEKYVLINHEWGNIKVELYLDIENMRLEMRLTISNVLVNISYLPIKYNPIDGSLL